MIVLDGLKLNQRGYTLYLTSATVEQIKRWSEEDRICADIWKRERQDGYQREPDRNRFRKIAEYVERKLQVEETLLPNSVILNIRQTGMIGFEPYNEADKGKAQSIIAGKIRIPDEAFPFYEVDGQHRIRGLITAYDELKGLRDKQGTDYEEIRSYPIPLAIIEGLDRPAEAIQFVVINSTQKKVDPALVLRILHKRYRDKSQKLEYFLKGGSWRLHAVDVCDQLNGEPGSPWCDKIIAPGDKRKGRVISEQNFVNSLEPVYSRLDPGDVKQFLPLYWKAIANLWPECTGENAISYSLQRTNGVNAFHGLLPLVYFKARSLGKSNLKGLVEILRPVQKKFRPEFWQRGGAAKAYTSRAAQQQLVDQMITAMPDGKELKLSKHPPRQLSGGKEKKVWEDAQRLVPLRSYWLFSREKVESIDQGATGAYIFYSFTKRRFYTGRSDKAELKKRLLQHWHDRQSNQFHIFNYRLCSDPTEAHDMECALYHTIPQHLLSNKSHPSALAGKQCPFCGA